MVGEIIGLKIGDAIIDGRPVSGNIHDIIAENKELKDILRTLLESDVDSDIDIAVSKAIDILNKPK